MEVDLLQHDMTEESVQGELFLISEMAAKIRQYVTQIKETDKYLNSY